MSSPDAETGARAARASLLLFSEDPALRSFFSDQLGGSYAVVVAEREDDLVRWLEGETRFDLVVVDYAAGQGERAFTLRERLVAAGHDAPMVMMMDPGDEETAVEALKRGFVDYIAKRRDTMQADLMTKRIASNLELARLKTENARLLHAIEESQQRLFNIYDSLDDVIMQVDEDCRVVSLNRSAAALANCEPKEAVGRVCWELFDFYPCERRAKKESCHIYRTFLEGETIHGEREDQEGRQYQYMTFITTLKGDDYTVYRESDVTEKRRLEQRISDALRSLGADPEARRPSD